MSWALGISLLGLGLTLFFSVVQMMGVTWPRWLLSALASAGIVLMLVWPLSFLWVWLSRHFGGQSRLGSLLIVIAVGAAFGGVLAGVTWWFIGQELQPRVQWDFGGFLAMGGYPVGPGESIALRISGFQAHGTNNSDEPITSISGYLRSNLTNETLPLYMIVGGLPVAPEKTNGVPPRATFGVVIPFGPDSFKSHGMLNEETFLRKFGDFTVVIELDGRREEHRFSSERILRLISDWKRGVYGSDKPGVTKKDHQP